MSPVIGPPDCPSVFGSWRVRSPLILVHVCAAVRRLPDVLRRGVEHVRVDRREDDRVRPLPALLHGARRLAREDPRIRVHLARLAGACGSSASGSAPLLPSREEHVGVVRVRRDVAVLRAAGAVHRGAPPRPRPPPRRRVPPRPAICAPTDARLRSRCRPCCRPAASRRRGTARGSSWRRGRTAPSGSPAPSTSHGRASRRPSRPRRRRRCRPRGASGRPGRSTGRGGRRACPRRWS